MSDVYQKLFYDKQEQLLKVSIKAMELLKEINNFETFHPRAVKLLRKQKNFIVIAEDEPYFEQVYLMIREHEISKGTWTDDDEHIYQKSISGEV